MTLVTYVCCAATSVEVVLDREHVKSMSRVHDIIPWSDAKQVHQALNLVPALGSSFLGGIVL